MGTLKRKTWLRFPNNVHNTGVKSGGE